MSAGRFTPSPGMTYDHQSLASQLRLRLLALDYPSFARCVCVLLESLGYEGARPAGRQEWKGYNRPGGGGYDLEAVLPGGLVPRRVVVQIKQYDGLKVHQRNVDELLGACLRSGAGETLLITTSSFSKVVEKAQAGRKGAASSDGTAALDRASALTAPVRLIDGKELLALMIRFRIGVCQRSRGEKQQLDIDEIFFRMITARKASVGKAAYESSNSADHESGTLAKEVAPLPLTDFVPIRWRVTIRISASSCPGTQRDGIEESKTDESELPGCGMAEGGG